MTNRSSLKVLAFLLLGACAGENGGLGFEETERIGQTLYADSNRLFMPTGDSHTTQLKFCWQNSAQGYSTERGWVQTVVNNSWQANSWISFTWETQWSSNACSPDAIPLKNEDVWPAGDSSGVTFNFINPASYGGSRGCTSERNCIEGVAVHEIGHVLGFDHEQGRGALDCAVGPDFPADTANGTVDGDLALGPKDADSVMGGCPTASVKLSAGDIAGLKAVYGGDGDAVKHNQIVAIREADGKYWKLSGSTFSLAGSYDTSTSWTVQRSGKTSGSVAYGDKVIIKRGSTFMCGKKGSSCPPGNSVCAVVPPKRNWTTTYSSANCDWTVQQSSSANAGGSYVDVNDAFKLYLKITAANSSELTFEQTTGKLRMLKDI